MTKHFICPRNVYRFRNKLYVVVYCWSENAIEIKELERGTNRMVSPIDLRYEADFVGSNYKEK